MFLEKKADLYNELSEKKSANMKMNNTCNNNNNSNSPNLNSVDP